MGDLETLERSALSRSPVAVVRLLRAGDWKGAGEALERAARILFAAAIFLVPIVIDPRTLDAFSLVKLTTLWVVGLLACGLWLLGTQLAGSPRSISSSPVVYASCVLLAIVGVATLMSSNPRLAFFGLYHRYEGFVSLAMYIGVLLFMAAVYRRRPDALRELAVAVGASGGIVGGYVIFQRAGLDVAQWRLGASLPPFPIGSLGNSAFTASFIGIAVPFICYLGMSTTSRARRAVWAAVGALALLGLLFTQGRAGLSAAVVGVLAFFLLSSRVRTALKLAVIVAALLALALAPIFAGNLAGSTTQGVLRTGTAGYRAVLWDATADMIRERPVVGWGPESYFGNYPRFRTAEEARRFGLAIPDSPHSIYLDKAVTSGIAGFGVFLVVVGTALILVARRARSMASARRRLCAAFGAGLVAYLAQGIYSIDVPALALMGWATLGGIAVLTKADEAMTTRRRSVGRTAVSVIGGLMVLVLIVFGFGPLRADHAAWAAARRSVKGWSEETLALYEKAIAVNPREAAYRDVAARYLERMYADAGPAFSPEDALLRASDLYLQAHNLQPLNIYFLISLARIELKLGKFGGDSASGIDRWMRRAASLDPLDPALRELYAKMLRESATDVRGRERREVRRRANEQAAAAESLREG